MTFTEAWMPHRSCVSLARLAQETKNLTGRVVEVGSWEGRSTVALAHAVWPETVHAVDTWEGSPGELSWELAHGDRNIFATFCENVATLTRGNIESHQRDWRDYFAADQTPVRFCFIDATHTYDEVRANIEAVKPLVVDYGIICGDDRHHDPVLDAAKDVLGEVTFDATLWIWRN